MKWTHCGVTSSLGALVLIHRSTASNPYTELSSPITLSKMHSLRTTLNLCSPLPKWPHLLSQFILASLYHTFHFRPDPILLSILVIVFMFWKLLVCILESTIYIGKCIREPNKEESFLMSLQYSRKGINKTTNYTYAFNESYKWRSTFHSSTFNMKVHWLQFWKQKHHFNCAVNKYCYSFWVYAFNLDKILHI